MEKPYAVAWNEGGRSTAEIASTCLHFMAQLYNRDTQKFTFWVDNCPAQNKGWYLFTALLCC